MTKQPKGFSLIEFILILLVVLAAGCSGWFLWHRSHKDSAAKQPNTSTNTPHATNATTPSRQGDASEGWQSYTNAQYGISFKYPEDWKIGTVGPFNAPDSATKQEYAINVDHNEDVKYNGAVSIEVLNENLEAAVVWYDKAFSASHVTKTETNIKDRRSIEYAQSSGFETAVKTYLFSMGNKTLVFASLDTLLNEQAGPDYWTKFDKVLDSLQISL